MEREPDVVRQAMRVAQMAAGKGAADGRPRTRRVLRVWWAGLPTVGRLELSLDLVVIGLFFSAVVSIFAYVLFGI